MDGREPTGGDELIALGRISGVHGVRGWVKVFSYTDPRENILGYPQWWLTRGRERRLFRVRDGSAGGRTIIAALDSIEDEPGDRALPSALRPHFLHRSLQDSSHGSPPQTPAPQLGLSNVHTRHARGALRV